MDSVTAVKIMTYNVHSCIGADKRLSPIRIAGVISGCGADIVALQELDNGLSRTGHVHQAEMIAKHLGMDFHFHPSFETGGGQYGNAILSRYPFRMIKAEPLPPYGRKFEKRSALWASIEIRGREVQIINTHLGLNSRERSVQAETLLGSGWLLHPLCCSSPVVFCGDLNALPVSNTYRRFKRVFRDVQLLFNGTRPRSTYPGICPLFRIDHVFVGSDITVQKAEVLRTKLTRVASDHLPLIAMVDIR